MKWTSFPLKLLSGWYAGYWFRARGGAAWGFSGSTLDRLIFTGVAIWLWPVVLWLAWPLEWAAGGFAGLFLLTFLAVCLPHGNFFGLGTRPGGDPEQPTDWLAGLFGKADNSSEVSRTDYQRRGAAIRINYMILPALVIFLCLVGLWGLPALLLLLPAFLLTGRIARARLLDKGLDPTGQPGPNMREILRKIRVELNDAFLGDVGGSSGAWQTLEFAGGILVGFTSNLLALLAIILVLA